MEGKSKKRIRKSDKKKDQSKRIQPEKSSQEKIRTGNYQKGTLSKSMMNLADQLTLPSKFTTL